MLNGRVEVEWQRRARSECECSTREKKSLCVLELRRGQREGGERGQGALRVAAKGARVPAMPRCLALEGPVRGDRVRRDEDLRRAGGFCRRGLEPVQGPTEGGRGQGLWAGLARSGGSFEDEGPRAR